jgi:hypothetical protein
VAHDNNIELEGASFRSVSQGDVGERDECHHVNFFGSQQCMHARVLCCLCNFSRNKQVHAVANWLVALVI